MKVTSLEISGFRAFSGTETFDLDADTLIVVGANGQGKTSFFDAILWALAGEIPRLGSSESVVSLYSPSGEARVAVGLVDDENRRLRVTRRFDGKASQVGLEVNGANLRGRRAEAALLEELWPAGLAAVDPQASLRAALERGVYLQQDLLTAFLSADTDQDRFSVISELVGVGRVTEFQTSLERSRLAWSRVTNARASETVELEERLNRIQTQLEATVGGETAPVKPDAWKAWWLGAHSLGLSSIETPNVEAPVAAGRLDTGIRELQAIQLAAERRRDLAEGLRSELEALPPPPSHNLDALRLAQQNANLQLTNAKETLAAAEEHSALLRRKQVELNEQREELRALAELALRHLGERCPVCDQDYGRAATKRRLEGLVRSGPAVAPSQPTGDIPDVAALAALVQEQEKLAGAAQRQLLDAERSVREWTARRDQLTARLTGLGIGTETDADPLSRVTEMSTSLEGQVAALVEARQRGEELALALARAGQRARQSELEREIGELRHALETARRDRDARQRTVQLVATLIEALRGASADVVENQLRRLEPLLQRIYATADPHPAFRVVKLLSRMRQGRGRILSSVADPVYNIESESPASVLSSSQMNVLAVSVFLALNLGMPALPLRATILDDPLQSLDDLNLLGLIDLLRRIRERRQVMISTHDTRFAALLERKLRPVAEGQRTVVISMQGWSREGPTVEQREVERDRVPVRIAV